MTFEYRILLALAGLGWYLFVRWCLSHVCEQRDPRGLWTDIPVLVADLWGNTCFNSVGWSPNVLVFRSPLGPRRGRLPVLKPARRNRRATITA